MTEKEVYKNGVALLEEWEDVNYCEHSFKFKDEWLTDKEVVDKLNELAEENKRLKSINQDYCNYIGDFEDDFIRLAEENKELKERNNRQCKQLDDLCRLIEEKDWRALTDIMDDFKKADEQLQKEWKCYE